MVKVIGAVLAMAVSVLLPTLPAAAQVHEPASAGKAAPSQASKHRGRLFARMFLYTDQNAFLKAWGRRADGLHVKNVSKLRRGALLTAVVAFANCDADARGNCNAKVDFTVLRPDGSVYAHLKDLDLWSGRKAPPRHELELSFDNLHIRIDPTDPLGKYTVKARVRDLNTGKQVTVTKAFTVIGGEPAAGTKAVPKPKGG